MEIVNNQGKWAELLAQVRASDFYEKNGYIKSAEKIRYMFPKCVDEKETNLKV